MSRNKLTNMTVINIINANARSLKPKTKSMLDCMTEMDIDFAYSLKHGYKTEKLRFWHRTYL